MQYKNPIDIDLVQAAEDMVEGVQYALEQLGAPATSSTIMLRLKNAAYNARTEMQAERQMMEADLVQEAPPTSMD